MFGILGAYYVQLFVLILPSTWLLFGNAVATGDNEPWVSFGIDVSEETLPIHHACLVLMQKNAVVLPRFSLVQAVVDGSGFAGEAAAEGDTPGHTLAEVGVRRPNSTVWQRIVKTAGPDGKVWRHILNASHAANATTAADVAGVSSNEEGDLRTLLSSLALDSIVICALLVIFSFLRHEFELVYSGNVKRKGVDEGSGSFPPVPRGWGPLSWVRGSLCTTVDDIQEHIGLDSAMLIEFSHLAMKICATIGIPMCLMMCPAHVWVGGMSPYEVDPLSRIGMANIASGSWLYWVHAVIVWLVILSVEYWIEQAMQAFLARRWKWLKQMPAPRSTTVLVESIPDEYCSDMRLRRYFSQMFPPDQVKVVYVVRKTDALLGLVDSWNASHLLLKRAQAFEVASGELAQHRVLGEGLVDSVGHYQKDMERLSAAILSERVRLSTAALAESPNPAVCANSAFITFGTRRDAEIALRLQYKADAEQFTMSIPPDPLDIRWCELKADKAREKLSERFGYACVVGLYIGFIPITIAISSVTNLSALRTQSPFVDNFLITYPLLGTMLEGILASFALTLFMSFLPTLLVMIIDKFFVLKANAWVQQRLQVWYFWFQMIFVLLVTAVGNSVINAFEQIMRQPFQVFGLLADSLPSATHFYLNFMVLQWVTHAMNLTRYINLFKYLALLPILGQTQAKGLSEPEDQDYYGFGSRSARWAIMTSIAIVFCSLSPLISILTFANFALCRLVYGYLITYAEEKKPDLGGIFFVQQLEHLLKGLSLYVALMIGVLLRRGPGFGPVYLATGALVYHIRAHRTLSTRYCWEQLPFEAIVGDDMEGKQTCSCGNYFQTELFEEAMEEGYEGRTLSGAEGTRRGGQ